jgi:hypothetical protein
MGRETKRGCRKQRAAREPRASARPASEPTTGMAGAVSGFDSRSPRLVVDVGKSLILMDRVRLARRLLKERC